MLYNACHNQYSVPNIRKSNNQYIHIGWLNISSPISRNRAICLKKRWSFLNYLNNPEAILDLNIEIYAAIVKIRPETIENIFKTWVDRMDYCQISRGSNLAEIIFHG